MQEISGAAISANLLAGSMDERFQRTDSLGTANFLTDALGSTLALTNSSGSTLAQYAYEPFGNTAVTSGSSSNSYEYTGRENDGTGLYFYRARYYSPILQRFISEDPIGMGGGMNYYAYVTNDPIGFSDPFGRDKTKQGNPGVPVVLPDGSNVPDPKSPTGLLMSPVADLGPVAAAGKQAGEMYQAVLDTGDPGAILFLGGNLAGAVGTGGTFDYQRSGNPITGFVQSPQFRDVANFNVGLYGQQAGLTEAETLSISQDCARTVPKLDPFLALGIALSEKQIPQVVENTEN